MELEIDYDLLEEKIAHIMAKAPREDEVLWDADECAAYLPSIVVTSATRSAN